MDGGVGVAGEDEDKAPTCILDNNQPSYIPLTDQETESSS